MKRDLNWNSMWAIIQKEILDSVRNKWVLAITVIFALLALLVSYFGSTASASTGEEVGFRGFDLTIFFILAIAEFLIPIIALMLGYGAIVSEKEKGSLDLLVSMPITRAQIFVAKFLGLSMVLFISIFLGFGLAGIVIAAFAGSAQWTVFLSFIAASALVGLVFLSLAMLLSTVMKRRSTAMGGAVLLWFLFIWIYTIVLYGVGALVGIFDQGATIPDWFYAFQLMSPVSSYEVMTVSELGAFAGSELPWFYSGATAWLVVALWIFIPLLVSLWLFTKKDIQR
jgi:Cu-processing system permease protein